MEIKISKAEKDMMDIMEKECIDNKVKEMKLRPDWINYVELYKGLCYEAVTNKQRIDIKSKEFIERFYKNNKELLDEMTIGEIIDGLEILELKGLIYKNEDFIELRDYRYIQMLYYHRKKEIEKNIFGW